MNFLFKNLKTLFVLPLLAIFSMFSVSAASLSLTKLGTIDTAGSNYSEWWYTNTSALLTGTAAVGQKVNIKVDSTAASVDPASSGAWSYQLTGESKDYKIEISQGSEKISFVLHLGQQLPQNITQGTTNQTNQSTTPTPVTGFNQIIALSLGLGIILLASYFYFWGDTRKKSVFEAKMIKEN